MRFAVLLPMLLISTTGLAHAPRHHEAHVHGQAVVDLSLEGAALEIALDAPGIGILDFERAPATAQERAALARAQRILQSADWVRLPPAAGCRIVDASARADGFATMRSHAGEAGQAHHHDHLHTGFKASVRYRCTSVSALRALDIILPRRFTGLHKVVVNTVTPTAQGRAVLDAANVRVELAP